MTRARERYVRALDRYADYEYPTLRGGLGLVIVLAGAHKVVAPGAWSRYTAGPIAAAWPLPLDATMVANGVIEVAFGLALLANVFPTMIAGVIALSLLGVVANLALEAALTGRFVDVLIRDLGLAALAVGVTLRAARGAHR